MKLTSLFTLAMLATASSSVNATHVTVPGDFATIQQALDSAADTVNVASGNFAEDLVMVRPVVLLPAFMPNGAVSFPQVRSLRIDNSQAPTFWTPAVIRGFRFRGPVRLITGPQYLTLTLESCRLDAGLIHDGDNIGSGAIHVQYCTIFGGANLHHDAVEFTLNTVLGGGVSIRSVGYHVIQGNHVQDAQGVGILSNNSYYPPSVQDNTVTRCTSGMRSFTGGYFKRNSVTDCSGDGYAGGLLPAEAPVRSVASAVTTESPSGAVGVLNLIGNRFERCGRGIYVPPIYYYRTEILDNVVLRCTGDGIAAFGVLAGNTVAQSGGNGITAPATLGGRAPLNESVIERNVSAFNAGFGFLGTGREHLSCNDWFGNGGGATHGVPPAGNDVLLDPLFCDLDGGDVRVSNLSPLWSAPCGPIGADTIGCATGAVLLDAPRPRSPGLTLRVRGEIAQLSLVDSSPASLEVIDLQGRRVSSLELAAPSPGLREVSFGHGLPAGVYFLRLRQGGQETSGKAIRLP